MATISSNDLTENLERLVTDFVRASQELVLAAVAQAMVASSPELTSAPAPKPSKRTKPSKQSKPSKRAKPSKHRSPQEIAELGERFYEVLCAHPGESMTVLAEKVGVCARELHHPVKRLKRAGRVHSVGQRQSTKYFPSVRDAEAA
jgi:hypothetical protein